MDLFYRDTLIGIPLLLLHGFPLDHTIWQKVIQKMDKRIRIIAPDLRGHGRSMGSVTNFSITDMAQDVIRLIDRLKIEKVIIAGHSMGGYVALDLYRHFSERLIGLALVSSNVKADSIEKKRQRMDSIDKIYAQGVSYALADMPNLLSHDPDVKNVCAKIIAKMDLIGAIGAQYAMAGRKSSVKIWRSMKIGQMVISGSDDQLISIETSRKISRQSRNSVLIEIENAGHMPMLEEPNKVAEAMKKFILNDQRS